MTSLADTPIVNMFIGLIVAIALAFTAASMAGRPAVAVLVPIVNQGFETPATQGTTTPMGWTLINSNGNTDSYNPYEFSGGNAYYIGANPTTDPANGGSGYPGIMGENLAFALQTANSGLAQTLSANLTANTTYTLTVEEGARNGTFVGAFLGSTIELLAGSTVIAASVDHVGPAAGTFKDQVALLANSNAFSGLIGQALTIEFFTNNAVTAQSATDRDNVRLDASPAAVPEPASLVLMLLGLAGASAYTWRRKRLLAFA